MPESVTDRPTKSHEYLFLLAKQKQYYYDAEAIAEPIALSQIGRVRSDVIGGTAWQERGQHSLGGRYETHEYVGKHLTTNKQAASRRMLLNVRRARDNGHHHDAPFGMMRNKRSVWTITTEPYDGAHFATMPEALIEPCILAGCPISGIVLDPFVGSGTVGAVATRLGRRWIGLDLAYQDLARERTAQLGLPFVTGVDSAHAGDGEDLTGSLRDRLMALVREQIGIGVSSRVCVVCGQTSLTLRLPIHHAPDCWVGRIAAIVIAHRQLDRGDSPDDLS